MTIKNSRLYRYGKELNTHDLIKIVAILLMIADHIGEYLLNDNREYRLLGRGAAPLFFFLIGYVHKLRITPSFIIYGLILSLTGAFIGKHLWISILINFIVIDILLTCFSIEKSNTLTRALLFLGATIATILTYTYFEYGFLGLMIAFAGRLIATHDQQGGFWLACSFMLYYVYESLYFGFAPHLSYLMIFGFMMLCGYFALRTYRLRQITCPRLCLLPGLFLSRYSLEIYFYHVIIFQGYYIFKHYYPS